MNKKQVALVQITKNGSDLAVYLHGEYVISADPGAGDSLDAVAQVAESLAKIEGVTIDAIAYGPDEDWCWNDVEAHLKEQGLLVSVFVKQK